MSQNWIQSADILEDSLPSEDIMKVLFELNTVGFEMDRNLNKIAIMTEIMDKVFESMLQGTSIVLFI